ncbi:MAG: transglycosylase family protein [Thermoleophilaceae bacterium]
MRRLMALALSASVVAAPISVSTAQSETEPKHHVANFVNTKIDGRKTDVRQLTRAAKRGVERRAEKRAAKREAAAAQAVAVPPHLEAIAQCESGGDPTAVSADGMYHGKFQFSVATWQAMGGSGLPSQAPEAEQDMRAVMLYEQSGPGQWPVCGA